MTTGGGDWLPKTVTSVDLGQFKTLFDKPKSKTPPPAVTYEELIEANADVISKAAVTKTRKLWENRSLQIGWAYTPCDHEKVPTDKHRYDLAWYSTGSHYVKKAPTDGFPNDLISALKENIEKIEDTVSVCDPPKTPTCKADSRVIYIYILISPVHETRSKERKEIKFQVIEHDLNGEKVKSGYDVRIAASVYAIKVANCVEQNRKIDRYDANRVKLKVGKSFLKTKPSSDELKKDKTESWSRNVGLANRWSTTYKGVYDEPMLPLVIITDGDLPDFLKTYAGRKGETEKTEGDSRDEIALRIEETIARRGKLWGYDLDNDQKGDHPTPKKGGGDASVVYLVHRELVRCAVRAIENAKSAIEQSVDAVRYIDDNVASAIDRLLEYKDSVQLASKTKGRSTKSSKGKKK